MNGGTELLCYTNTTIHINRCRRRGSAALCLLRWLGLSRSGETCMSPLTPAAAAAVRCVRMTKRTRWGYYDGRDGPPFCFCSILIVCSGLVRYGGGAPVRAARTPIALTAGGIRSNSGKSSSVFWLGRLVSPRAEICCRRSTLSFPSRPSPPHQGRCHVMTETDKGSECDTATVSVFLTATNTQCSSQLTNT